MSTITLPNIRVSSDLTARVRLKDGGLAIDWSTLNNIRAHVYSDAQRALAGRCDVSVDTDDHTVLVCEYSANKPQYLGVNRIVVQARYMGETKTYDKPALNFVRWTDDQEGEEIVISDPDIDVEINVEDVTSSILQNILDACIKATEEAQEVVDVGRGPRGYSAYEIAVQEGYQGTEEEWLASLEGDAGPQGPQGVQGPVGPAGVSSAVVTVDNTTGTPSATASVSEGVLSIAITGIKGEQGPQGTQGVQGETGATPVFTIGTVETAAEGEPASVTITGTPSAPVLNLKLPRGLQGNTGSSVEYPFELVNNRTTDDATKGLSAAEGKRMGDDISQLEAKVVGGKNVITGWTTGKNIYTNQGVGATCPKTLNTSASWQCKIITIKEGATYIVNGQGGSSPRLWCFLDSNDIILSVCASEKTYANDSLVLTPPTGATQLIVNSKNTDPCYECFEGALDEVYEMIDEEVLKNDEQLLTPAQQKTVRENLAISDVLLGKPQNYLKDVTISSAGQIISNAGLCLTDFIPIVAGSHIVWTFGDIADDVAICTFDASKAFVGYYSSYSYGDVREIDISSSSQSRFVRASFNKVKTDGSQNYFPIIVDGVSYPYHDAVPSYFDYVKDNIEDEKRWKPLVLGGLVNSDTNSAGQLNPSQQYDSKRVTTKSIVTPPFPGARIRMRFTKDVPYFFQAYFFMGDSSDSMNTSWDGHIAFMDGSSATIPATIRSIRPVFRAGTKMGTWTSDITAATVQGWIDEGTLALEYYDESPDDVVRRNEATRINLAALRRVFIPGGGAQNGMDSLPVFAHITDIHGDAQRWKNCMEYCDKVGVDFALETGDAAMYLKRDASKFIYDIACEHDTDVIACIGNHEASPTGSSTLFADNLSDLATKYEYLASSGTATTKCYFYKDYDAKKVRVIVLNQHEDGVYRRRIGQAQVDWFISTLLSTPAGYGIVIAYHAPEDKVVAESPYDVFRQPVPNTGASYEPNGAYVDKRVVELLVDAFISRTSVNFTYEDHSATYNGDSDVTTQTVSVVADFSGVDETTEFICYVCGHRHEDWIGYYDHSENKQLCLCITCGNALYGDSSNPAWANQSDLPRGGVGVSQDAFCVYAIDRLNGNVKVMRVGATVTQMMVKREMMVIPYKD